MRSFSCQQCHSQLVFFENTRCLHCDSPLGFVRELGEVRALAPAGPGLYQLIDSEDDALWRRCANQDLAWCNWMVRDGASPDGLCASCALTRTRPADVDADGLRAFATAEAAKRRLVAQLDRLRLPVISKRDDPGQGLTFDLLSSAEESVTIGHADGVVTLDLAESDDAYRERTRHELGEPYRTLLGHFRHETGHYYWGVIVEPTPALADCRALFGDDRTDYQESIDRHYAEGPPADWRENYVSGYATMHPYEDWAETFAHYLHIRDSLETAAAFGIIVTGPPDGPAHQAVDDLVALPTALEADPADLTPLLDAWLPLTYALNAINRSMGKDDLYPFVLAPPVVEKLAFVHRCVSAASRPA